MKTVSATPDFATIPFTLIRGKRTKGQTVTANVLFHPKGSDKLNLSDEVEKEAEVTFDFPRVASLEDVKALAAALPEVDLFGMLQAKLASTFTQRNYSKLADLSKPIAKFKRDEIVSALKPPVKRVGTSSKMKECKLIYKAAQRQTVEAVRVSMLKSLRETYPVEMATIEGGE